MPIISVPRDHFFDALEQKYTDDQFKELCFEFGIELDDITSEKELVEREQGKEAAAKLGKEAEEKIYKIEVPANRYDLLCLEGLVQALRAFKGKQKLPEYKLLTPKKMIQFTQTKETKTVRPFVAGAVLRNIKFTAQSLKSFIDLQEKLHATIGRKRTLVAIGTHDLDKVQAPFTYEALPQTEISFVPLKETKTFRVDELFAHYNDEKTVSSIKGYLHITKDSPVHPVIFDKNREVLSLPPIINGQRTALTVDTKNIFIDVTGTDWTKVNTALNLLVCQFSIYCSQKYTIEPIELVDADGKKTILPNLQDTEFKTTAEYLNKGIGITLSEEKIVEYLHRMSLRAKVEGKDGKKSIVVAAPPTRPDVLHACDIMEDVAIAFGYNNIPKTVPVLGTVGKEFPLTKLAELNRVAIAQAGFTEVLTWSLVSRAENYTLLNREEPGKEAVTLQNPQTKEFQIVRTNLLGSLMKVLEASKGHPMPINLFEVSDVAILTNDSDVGAKNERHIGALHVGPTSGFELIHGLLDRIMLVNKVVWHEDARDEEKEGEEKEGEAKWVYSLEKSDDPAFFPGRRADVLINKKKVGVFGTLHPTVMKNFDVAYSASALELNLDAFLEIQ